MGLHPIKYPLLASEDIIKKFPYHSLVCSWSPGHLSCTGTSSSVLFSSMNLLVHSFPLKLSLLSFQESSFVIQKIINKKKIFFLDRFLSSTKTKSLQKILTSTEMKKVNTNEKRQSPILWKAINNFAENATSLLKGWQDLSSIDRDYRV